MRYLLNSAVLTQFGSYEYRPLSLPELRDWVLTHLRPPQDGGWLSTIGYPETAMALDTVCGLTLGTIPVSRQTIAMQPGDEAVVFRVIWPSGTRPDAASKGALGIEFILQHCEKGLLSRVA